MDWKKLLDFLSIESVSGNEKKAAEWIHSYLHSIGWDAELIEVEPQRYNVYSNLNSRVLFCSHFDVVPPHIPPSEEGERITGRGSADAKGVIMSQVEAAVKMVDEGILRKEEIGFAYVCGEEVDHLGAKYLEKEEFHASIAIVGEPTENMLCKFGFGLLKVRFIATGKVGHSAFPDSGHSAIHDLIELLGGLGEICGEKEGVGKTTYNIGMISGGIAANVYAPRAEATVLFRLAESSNGMEEKIQDLIERWKSVTFEVLSKFDPIEFTVVDGIEKTVARFNSDAKYLKEKVDNLLLFGPGDIKVAHSEDEFISKQSFLDGIDTYVSAVKSLIE